jgi:hypothetical protein
VPRGMIACCSQLSIGRCCNGAALQHVVLCCDESGCMATLRAVLQAGVLRRNKHATGSDSMFSSSVANRPDPTVPQLACHVGRTVPQLARVDPNSLQRHVRAATSTAPASQHRSSAESAAAAAAELNGPPLLSTLQQLVYLSVACSGASSEVNAPSSNRHAASVSLASCCIAWVQIGLDAIVCRRRAFEQRQRAVGVRNAVARRAALGCARAQSSTVRRRPSPGVDAQGAPAVERAGTGTGTTGVGVVRCSEQDAIM